MKAIAVAITASVIVIALSFSLAQENAEQAEGRSIRDLSGFDSIQVGGGIDVEVQLGDKFQVEVRAEEHELDNVVTRIEGSTLVVRLDGHGGGWFDWFGSSPWVMVTLPDLVSVRASGGSNVMTHSRLSGDRLSITASGGADVHMDATLTELAVNASGGADVFISGTADSALFETSGGSDVNAMRLAAQEVQVQSSGGSDIMVAVDGRLFGHASGGSDVIYSGNPQTVDVRVSGGADLVHH